jgi:hypothetical protein
VWAQEAHKHGRDRVEYQNELAKDNSKRDVHLEKRKAFIAKQKERQTKSTDKRSGRAQHDKHNRLC